VSGVRKTPRGRRQPSATAAAQARLHDVRRREARRGPAVRPPGGPAARASGACRGAGAAVLRAKAHRAAAIRTDRLINTGQPAATRYPRS